ncbi:hypothetical protein BCR43DRAFT_523003 [Syncephalastrum racemosum]|uniref:Microtubule-associated protein n=1 Tax=Syncephalastrum racemosum TaxID=13706 RepID=A0A1X2HIR7_SYNRA|nr:hypothetical protein BCR43DRAFT_523003 [Syncephalastrum racemosum]
MLQGDENIRPTSAARRSRSHSSTSRSSASATKRIPTQPLPSFDHIKSKIGSLDNIKRKSGSGKVLSAAGSDTSSDTSSRSRPMSIGGRLPDFSHVKSKVGSLDNIKHKPGGGQKSLMSPTTSHASDSSGNSSSLSRTKSLTTRRPDYSHVKSKIGSLDNIKHKPGGGDKRILSPTESNASGNSSGNSSLSPTKSLPSRRRDYSNVKSKVGSLDNIKHKPGGGEVKIYHEPKVFNAKSKVGSKDNIKHKPGGGDVKIYHESKVFNVKSKVGSKDNIKHKPGGGDVKIYHESKEYNAKSKVGSKDNIKHKPGGGDVKIYHETKEYNAQSKVGSKDNIKHKAGGGQVEIYSEHKDYSTVASRIDHGEDENATPSIEAGSQKSRTITEDSNDSTATKATAAAV